MSDLPSPSKSSACFTCQAGSGLLPTEAAETTLVPFINQPPAWPLSSCHRMSALPSPLKSPVSLTCHAGPGLVPMEFVDVTDVPFISQIAAWPLSFCHTMSAWPSPSKSPVPLACQDAMVPREALPVNLVPSMNHATSRPLSF